MTGEVAMPTPTVVQASKVSKRFSLRKDTSVKERIVTLGRAGRAHREEFWALRDVSIDIHSGSTVGLIGHNGSGKSTLLKVIGGIIEPTTGSIAKRGRIAALLELGAGFHPDLTGRENVFLNASVLGLDRKEIEQIFDSVVEFAQIGDFIDTQVKFYSSGMFVRLAFAVAVHTDPDILLVDEVLAVGDEAFQRKCLDKIRTFQEEGRTIVIVSHGLDQIAELCDRVVLLDQGEVVYDGDPPTAVARFRDLLEGGRTSLPGETPAEAPRIVGAELEVVHATDRGEARLGSDLVVSVDLHFPNPVHGWRCAIQIDTVLGTAVFGTTTTRLGVEPTVFAGSRRVHFRLRDLRMGTGKYFVNISVMDDAGRHLADARQVCSFTVEQYPLAAGPVYLVPEFLDSGAVNEG